MTNRLHIAALAPLFMVSACMGSASLQIRGQSVDEAAVELINGDFAQMVGIGPLTTTCDEVVEPEVGTEFGCLSTSGDNQTIEWGVRVDRDNHIDVQSHNVVLQLTLDALEQDAVAVLYGDNPLGVAIDCG